MRLIFLLYFNKKYSTQSAGLELGHENYEQAHFLDRFVQHLQNLAKI